VLDNVYDKKSASNNGEAEGSERVQTLPLKNSYSPVEEPVDIVRLLEELEELPEKAKRLPFNTLVGFNQERFYYLVLKIRANLPDDIKRAYRVARESERIVDEARSAALQQLESGRIEAIKTLEEAKQEAQRILEQARFRANQMVEKSEVYQMAAAQANEMLRRAETEAAEIRKGADEYARDVLSNMEAIMNKTLGTIQRGRETLERSRV
jgi:vacuolar-type H+-ATPase subunit H